MDLPTAHELRNLARAAPPGTAYAEPWLLDPDAPTARPATAASILYKRCSQLAALAGRGHQALELLRAPTENRLAEVLTAADCQAAVAELKQYWYEVAVFRHDGTVFSQGNCLYSGEPCHIVLARWGDRWDVPHPTFEVQREYLRSL